jgi:hypothetical protein
MQSGIHVRMRKKILANCATSLMILLSLSGCSSEKVNEKEALSQHLAKLNSAIDAFESTQSKEQSNPSETVEGINKHGEALEEDLLKLITVVQDLITDTDAVDEEAQAHLMQIRLYHYETSSLKFASSVDEVNLIYAKLNGLTVPFNDSEFQLVSVMEKISKVD